MKDKLRKLWRKNRTFLIFLALMFVFRSAVTLWSLIPMLPTARGFPVLGRFGYPKVII